MTVNPESAVSVLLPVLAVLIATGIAAYHRLSIAMWAALVAVALVASWMLSGSQTTIVVLAVLAALVAINPMPAPEKVILDVEPKR